MGCIKLDREFIDDLITIGKQVGKLEVGGLILLKKEVRSYAPKISEDLDLGVKTVKKDIYLFKDFLIPDQEVTGATVEFDEVWLNKMLWLSNKRYDSLIWWHSHNDMGVTPSPQDKITIKDLYRFSGKDMVTMLITNNRGEMHVETFIKTPLGAGVFTKTIDIVGKAPVYKYLKEQYVKEGLGRVKEKKLPKIDYSFHPQKFPNASHSRGKDLDQLKFPYPEDPLGIYNNTYIEETSEEIVESLCIALPRGIDTLVDMVVNDLPESEERIPKSERVNIYEKVARVLPNVLRNYEIIDKYLLVEYYNCLLYTSPSPRDRTRSRMPSSA